MRGPVALQALAQCLPLRVTLLDERAIYKYFGCEAILGVDIYINIYIYIYSVIGSIDELGSCM